MAWRQPINLQKLVVKYNNEVQEISPYPTPELYNDEKVNILANPYNASSWTKSANSDNGAAYSEMIGMGIGGFDFADWNSVMTTNSTAWIYNPAVGDHIRLEVTKTGDGVFSVNARAYAQSFSLWTNVTATPGYLGQWGPHTSLGFIIDDSSHAGAAYYVRSYSQRYNSSIQTCYRFLWASPISGDTNKSILSTVVNALVNNNEPGPGPSGDNPYEGGGLNNEPAGGEDQNFTETSDVILEPTLPSNPATGSGFITAFVPSLAEINSVADYLIDPTVLQALAGTVLKLSDVIIGLSIFPFTIDATGHKDVKLNLMGIHLTTGVDCHYSDSQFVTLNMGSIDIKKYWDNCLDYDPYTRISLYLPYVGYVDLDTDEVMGRTIGVKYNVDIVTGCCLALVIVDGSVLYQYPGECSCQIPITSVSFDSFLQSAVQLGITAASGSKAVKGAGGSVSQALEAVNYSQNSAEWSVNMAELEAAQSRFDGIKASVGDSLIGAAVSTVMNAKGYYTHAGAMSSCAGILGTQKPFIIIKRPKQCMPEGYESIRGFPCNMKSTLSDLSGYTEVGDIHLNIPEATVQEIVECEQYLKEGVYL